ncbi:Bardet-Biedl syndrome 5 protein [Dinochytrium kinnereticum]|nr:Bardet-Biedl syndrome 5 protein [Dinochytrium kinnereticum]
MTGFKTHLLSKPLDFWHFREIRFDLPPSELSPTAGEDIVETFKDIEDCRGNPNQPGTFVITILRIIWVHPKNPRINLSLGHDCILTDSIALNGSSSVVLQARLQLAKFEFVFGTGIEGDAKRVAKALGDVGRAFGVSRGYRDFGVGVPIVCDGGLNTLALEVVQDKADNVLNLTTDKRPTGTLYVTNIRMAWHAIPHKESLNISMPFCQIQDVRIQSSKFGTTLVVETTAGSGSFLLGFQVLPVQRMREVAKTIKKCIKIYAGRPIFGMTRKGGLDSMKARELENAIAALEKMKEDDVEIVSMDPTEEFILKLAEQRQFARVQAYKDSTEQAADDDVVFDGTLGLMVERIKPEGLTLSQLWKMG